MKHLFLVLFLGVISYSFAQSNKHFNLENGLAIQGYDPVAYFNNKAIQGDKKIVSTFHGTIYSFSSKENKKSFELNPLKYEPQYGGWCAFAMGDNGKKVDVDPETFKIIDGKLYLFYNAYFNNTLKSWNKDEINLKTKANKNWSTIIKQ